MALLLIYPAEDGRNIVVGTVYAGQPEGDIGVGIEHHLDPPIGLGLMALDPEQLGSDVLQIALPAQMFLEPGGLLNGPVVPVQDSRPHRSPLPIQRTEVGHHAAGTDAGNLRGVNPRLLQTGGDSRPGPGPPRTVRVLFHIARLALDGLITMGMLGPASPGTVHQHRFYAAGTPSLFNILRCRRAS